MRSGLGAQLGVATEEKYGKFKAPTRFLPFEQESLALDKNRVKSSGLRAGRLVQASNLAISTTRTVGGDFQLEFLDQGMGILLNQLHGETVTPTKVEEKSKKVYKQVHKIGTTDPYGKSLTVQVGRPDTGNTVRPFSYLGCKVVEFKISVDNSGTAMLSLSVDGADEVTSETLAEASYDADTLPFTFQQLACKIAGETVANVRSVELSIPIGQNTERFHLGNEGIKSEPIVNALIPIVCNATLEFASLADHERYKKETAVSLALTATGAEIGTEGEHFKAVFSMPSAKQVSSSPTVQGPDVLTTDVTFEIEDNGSEAPLTVEYLSTDSAL